MIGATKSRVFSRAQQDAESAKTGISTPQTENPAYRLAFRDMDFLLREDLRSLAAAGSGVRNEIDLVLLRRAEQRFGNGDGLFGADEQDRAFREAEAFIAGPQDLIGPGRRLRLGLEISF